MEKVLGFGSSSGDTTISDDIRKIKNEMNMVGLFVGACAGVCGIAVMNAIKVAENTREISEDGKKFAENVTSLIKLQQENDNKRIENDKVRQENDNLRLLYDSHVRMLDSETIVKIEKSLSSLNKLVKLMDSRLDNFDDTKSSKILEELGNMRAEIDRMPREYQEHSAEQLRQMELEIQKMERLAALINEKLENSHGHSSATAAGPGEAAWT